MTDEFAGTLRERVGVEQWHDEAGWQPVGPAWAAVLPDGPGPMVRGDALQSGRRWQVTMRVPPRLGLTHRLWWRGELLVVLAAETDPRLPDRQALRCEARPA